MATNFPSEDEKDAGLLPEGLRKGLVGWIAGAVTAGITAAIVVIVSLPPVRRAVVDPVCRVAALTPACEELHLVSPERRAAEARAALLQHIAGRWGDRGCQTVGEFRIEGDRILMRWAGEPSDRELRVLAAEGEIVRAEGWLPAATRGNAVELRLKADQLVLHDRTQAYPATLDRCEARP